LPHDSGNVWLPLYHRSNESVGSECSPRWAKTHPVDQKISASPSKDYPESKSEAIVQPALDGR
jgi:hypothetical protein